MSFSRLLRKYSRPSFPPSAPRGEGAHPPDKPPKSREASEPKPTLPRPWKKKDSSTTDRASSSSIPPSAPTCESPTSEGGVREMLVPMPLPDTTNVLTTNLILAPQSEMIPAIKPVPDGLAEAWDAVKDGPKIGNKSGELDVLDDALGGVVTSTQDDTAPLIPVISAAAAAVRQTDMGKAIKEGIDKFSEGIPVLMNALDELKSLHPFIGVVVLAFKTVYTLEQKRRDNDKKVISIYVGMKDMMAVLLLLRDVKNDKIVAPDGISVEDRLNVLVGRTADDIKTCSNMCDAYMKKRLLAKVLLSSVWDVKLLDFVKLFAQRRQEFEFELTMHTSQGVDKANVKLDVIGDAMKALDEKIDGLKAIFPQLASTEEKQLMDLVDAKGGVRAFRDDNKMLLDLEKTVSKTPGAREEGGRAPREQPKDAKFNAEDLRGDIFEDPNAAAEKNWVVFSRKFEAQKNQIIDELTLVVQRESDRVVRELKGVAHELIRDRSIHEIWVEMGWRRSVKARHFVLALRDYYLEATTSSTEHTSTSAISSTSSSDAWAVKFIDITWLQPILEAFDDDASGFITVTEVNRFTSSRPADWSLPHWVAFWAVGFRLSIIDYCQKIEGLFAKMEGIRDEVLPPNREMMDGYFTYVWGPVHSLTAAAPAPLPLSVNAEKFKSYLEAEEARLTTNLKAVNYMIDGTDTLSLITGAGRIEKTAFPLLYLLMKRDYEIMRIMRTKVPDSREIWDSVDSISRVRDALTYRVKDLTNNFTQQKLDPKTQFESFAYGIFKHFHDRGAFLSVDYVRSLSHPVVPYIDASEDQNVEIKDILNFDYKDKLDLAYWVYDGHSINDLPKHRDVESPLKDILGHWHGYFYEGEGTYGSDESMTSFVLEPGDGEQDFKAKAWSDRGLFTIKGSWSKGQNDTMQIRFKMSSFESADIDPVFFDGHYDPDRDALTGVWDISELELQTSVDPMEFRRIPPHYLAVYPSIKELSDNKTRELWKFAIAAVQNDIRRERWSWSYFSRRRDDRETIIPLTNRYYFFGTPTSDEEDEQMYAIGRCLTSADACFYESKAYNIRANTYVHRNAYCDSCHGLIGEARLFCLDCVHKPMERFRNIDLCCEPECLAARVTKRDDIVGPHEPNHKLVKARVPVLSRHYGRVYTAALEAFKGVRDSCARIAESIAHPPEEGKTGPDEQRALGNESNVAEVTAKIDKLDDASVLTAEDGTKAEAEDQPPQDSPQVQVQADDLPTCGKCNGRLSFPCWYCIFCKDDLFICDTCDRVGVPDLMRDSGKHVEGHHLIRCMASEVGDDTTSPTEQRLLSMEGRLDGMQTQLDALAGHVGDLTSSISALTGLFHKLAEAGRIVV